MAGLNDALGAFALGTLSKAAGQDFLTPMLDDVRQRDMFTFQQRETTRLREEARNKDREERRASRRGLLTALQAAGAVRAEDIVAAGGVDVLADMDDAEFAIQQQTLQRNRLKDLSEDEQKATAIAAARVRGIPVPDNAGREEVLGLLAQVDYHDLNRQDERQQRDERTRAMRTTIQQAGRDIGAMFERSQAVTMDTLRSAFGRHQQAAARLAAAGADLSDEDHEILQGELNSMADDIRRQQVHVGLNALAKETPAKIIAGLTQLDPDQRALAMERPSIAAAWSRVEYAANGLVGLGEEGAAKIGLGELYKQALEGDPAQDGALAQALAATAGKIAEGPRLVKEMEALELGTAEAARVAREVGALGFAAGGLDLGAYVDKKTGNFDRSQFLRDSYSEQLLRVDEMDPVAAQDFLTTLAAAGAPADMQRIAARGAQAGLNRTVGQTRPGDLLDLTTQAEQIGRQEDIAHAALDSMLATPPATTDKPASAGAAFGQMMAGPFATKQARIAPEYLAKLRGAVEATGKPLETQQAATEAWGQSLVDKIKEARQAGDEGLASAYATAAQEQATMTAALRTRAEVRSQMVTMLKQAAPVFAKFTGSAGGTDDSTKADLLQAFGVGAEQAAEGAATITDMASVLGALRDQTLAGLKGRTTEPQAAEAVAAELDRIYELAMRLDAQLQDPDVLKLYKGAGIVKGAAGDMPALELLAYLL